MALREYIVRPFIGNYLVLSGVRNERGDFVKLDISDRFVHKEEAEAKAKLANYIIMKARENFAQLKQKARG